ncbi:hypothetical protein L1049_001171 [Liquidambar formosana]|uniref:Transmembrane protein n=1 Tax=Liquidambar formosana TaxID=63359 RepID=A0AAP0R5X9_LIQFO
MMKSSHAIFFCLLTTALYILSQTITSSSSSSSSSSSLNYFPGGRFMEELSTSKIEYRKAKVLVDNTMRSTMQEGSIAVEHSSSGENLDALVYHTDYHGVTTHPSPTPKHPKP